MEPSPNLLAFLANRPTKTISAFKSALLAWLGEIGALKSAHSIAGSLLAPESLIYRQIWEAFKISFPTHVSPPEVDEDAFERAPQGYFMTEVMYPILQPLFLGMNVVGGKTSGDDHPRSISSSNQTFIPAQVAPPVHHRRQARSPTSPITAANRSPPPKGVSPPPSNGVYMSKVMHYVDDPKKLLTVLGYPRELVENPQVTFHLGVTHGNYKTFFVYGPPGDPDWAKRIVSRKLQTDLVNTSIHMDLAHPRKMQVNRKEAVKEVEAAIRDCFQAQPMEEDGEVQVMRVVPPPLGRNKRSISPKKKSLFSGGDSDSDPMNSSFSSDVNSPPPKSAKPHQTPSKDGAGDEVHEGEEEGGSSPQNMEEDPPASEK